MQLMLLLLLVQSWLIGNDSDAGRDWEQEDKGKTGWDGWMASPTRWTWVWVNSRSWWWTGRPGVLQFMGSQRVGHDWATELKWMLLLNNWNPLWPENILCFVDSIKKWLEDVRNVLATQSTTVYFFLATEDQERFELFILSKFLVENWSCWHTVKQKWSNRY